MKILVPVANSLAMLGILDIIVPGILVAYCMRVDYIKSHKKEINDNIENTPAIKTQSRYYFGTAIISYGCGLLIAYLACNVTSLPQPALLYVCPAMVFGYLGGAFMRKETIEMFWYDE